MRCVRQQLVGEIEPSAVLVVLLSPTTPSSPHTSPTIGSILSHQQPDPARMSSAKQIIDKALKEDFIVVFCRSLTLQPSPSPFSC